MRIALAFLLVSAVSGATAQDALRGKRLYLETGRLTGAASNCVECHGGLPGGAFGIGRAANNPAALERAVNAIGAMALFRGRLAAADYVDLAAYIGNPGVASPDPRLTMTAPPGGSTGTDRIDFGPTNAGTTSATATIRLTNMGQLPIKLIGMPRIAGADARDFAIRASDCLAGASLAAQQSCRTELVFQPITAGGTRSAALLIDHDWIEGTAAVALLGSAAQVVPPAESSGGGAAGLSLLLLLLVTLGGRRRNPVLPLSWQPH